MIRDTALSKRLKRLHDDTCQICCAKLSMPDGRGLSEAHHIRPLSPNHHGPDIATNILVLCPNHHALLDYGAIRIEPGRLRLHPDHAVAAENVAYHNAQIYRGISNDDDADAKGGGRVLGA